MKRPALALFVLIFALQVCHACWFGVDKANAQNEKPIQIAIFNPIQIYGDDISIKGLRLNLIYGTNENVTGLDLGLINSANGNVNGVQIGAFSTVEGDLHGWQWRLLNWVEGEGDGVRLSSFFNYAESFDGLQIGFVNNAGTFDGVQIGILNMVDQGHGLQIGLVNIIKSKDKFRFIPIVNWSF